MDHETLVAVQGYGKFFLLLLLTVVFYSYAYTIYKRQKTGKKDYEKYSKLVLDDSYDSRPLEEIEGSEKTSKNIKQKLEKGDK